MTIEEALQLVDAGKAFITTASVEEKRQLINLCRENGYLISGCSPSTWDEFPHLLCYKYGGSGHFTFSARSFRALSDEMEPYSFFDLFHTLDAIFVSDLL